MERTGRSAGRDSPLGKCGGPHLAAAQLPGQGTEPQRSLARQRPTRPAGLSDTLPFPHTRDEGPCAGIPGPTGGLGPDWRRRGGQQGQRGSRLLPLRGCVDTLLVRQLAPLSLRPNIVGHAALRRSSGEQRRFHRKRRVASPDLSGQHLAASGLGRLPAEGEAVGPGGNRLL